MIVLVFSLLVCSTLAREDPLATLLKSPSATLRLYSDFKAAQHLRFPAAEDHLRFSMFRKTARMVAAANSVEGHTATLALNKFSAMSQEEKQSFLGKVVGSSSR